MYLRTIFLWRSEESNFKKRKNVHEKNMSRELAVNFNSRSVKI